MNRESLLLIIVLGFFTQNVSGQTKGSLTGLVKTADGKPAAMVSVSLKGTAKGSPSNTKGEFEIRNVTPGSYTLIVSAVGLQSVELPLDIKAGLNVLPDIILEESEEQLQDIIIQGSRESFKTDLPSSSLRITSPLLETAQNIQVVTADLLRDQQVFDMLEGVQRNVSGAQRVEHWDNYARINMRGSQLTSFRNGMNVQISPWSPLAEDMSMVERIEFVKGPAGFMLAAGEPSGFYNVVTKKPTGHQKGEIAFSLGSFDTYRTTLDLDGKLSSDGRILYRFNGMGQLKGSYRDFEFNNRYSIAPVVKFNVDENTEVTFEYNHQYSQMNAIGSNYAFSTRGYADLPLNFTTAEPNLDPSQITDKAVFVVFDHRFNAGWRITAQGGYFRHDQVGQSLWPRGIKATNDSLMQRGISVWDAMGINKSAQVFLHGTFRTGAIFHTLLGGLDMSTRDYYADWSQGAPLGDSTFNIYAPVYGRVSAEEIPRWDRTQDVRERGVRYSNGYEALYLQDELQFFDTRLRLTLAGRYTRNHYINPYSGSSDDGKFTPRIGLSYSITGNTSAYVVFDQAFLANPGTDWQGNTFDPITGSNIEVGWKKDWFGDRWNSVVSVYQITKNNILTTDLEHAHPTTGQFIYSKQTGQQQIRGLELDVRGELAAGLGVVLNYAFTDAVITKDSDPEVVGNKVAGATTHIQNLWLNYRFPQRILSGLTFSLGYQYQAGRSSWFVWNNSENGLPDYFRLDGAIGYRKDNFSIQLTINNVLDKYLYSGAPYGGMFYWQTEPGRHARLSVGYRF